MEENVAFGDLNTTPLCELRRRIDFEKERFQFPKIRTENVNRY